MLAYVYLFLGNLAFSVVTESLAAAAFFRVFYGYVDRRALIAATLGTALTIPYVWFVFPTLLWSSPILIIVIAEVFAIGAETLIYRHLCTISLRQAFLLSLTANTASYILGISFNALIR